MKMVGPGVLYVCTAYFAQKPVLSDHGHREAADMIGEDQQ